MRATTPTSLRKGALSALFVAAVLVRASAAQEGGTIAGPPVSSLPDATAGKAPEIQVMGEGDQRVFVVNHGDSWSMHVENVQAQALLEHWHEVGGPKVEAKSILDYPFTLSVHHLAAERIVERILDGYGFTLHYDGKGKLDGVRVYSAEGTRIYKTPRLTESLTSWKQAEVPQDTGAATPAAPALPAE
jgi:hypothetical protein